ALPIAGSETPRSADVTTAPSVTGVTHASALRALSGVGVPQPYGVPAGAPYRSVIPAGMEVESMDSPSCAIVDQTGAGAAVCAQIGVVKMQNASTYIASDARAQATRLDLAFIAYSFQFTTRLSTSV